MDSYWTRTPKTSCKADGGEGRAAEKEKQKIARDARAKACRKRQVAMSREQGLKCNLSEMVLNASEPSYSDDHIEAYHNVSKNFQ